MLVRSKLFLPLQLRILKLLADKTREKKNDIDEMLNEEFGADGQQDPVGLFTMVVDLQYIVSGNAMGHYVVACCVKLIINGFGTGMSVFIHIPTLHKYY